MSIIQRRGAGTTSGITVDIEGNVMARTALVVGDFPVPAANQVLGLSGAAAAYVNGVLPLFVQTADKTVANTVAETSLVGTGSGSMTVPANLLTIGRTLRLKMRGYLSTKGVGPGTITIKIKYGSVVLVASATNTVTASIASRYWEIEADITCRTTGATGTVMTQGRFAYGPLAAPANLTFYELVSTAAVTIDTTAATLVDATITWSVADVANTITSTNGTFEALN